MIRHLQSARGRVDGESSIARVHARTKYWTVCGQHASARFALRDYTGVTCKLCLAVSGLLVLERERGCWCRPGFHATPMFPHEERCVRVRESLRKIRGAI